MESLWKSNAVRQRLKAAVVVVAMCASESLCNCRHASSKVRCTSAEVFFSSTQSILTAVSHANPDYPFSVKFLTAEEKLCGQVGQVFMGQMSFLTPNERRQSTEENLKVLTTASGLASSFLHPLLLPYTSFPTPVSHFLLFLYVSICCQFVYSMCCAFNPLCLQCFDTVGWALGGASSL